MNKRIVLGVLLPPYGIYMLTRKGDVPPWAAVTLAAVGTLVLIGALGAAMGGGESQPTAAPTAPATRTSPNPKLVRTVSPEARRTADIRRWASRISNFTEAIGEASTNIAEASGEPDVLVNESDSWWKMATGLGALNACTSLFEATKPPHGAPAARDIRLACGQYERAGSLIARGMDARDAAMLTAGANRMVTGTSYIRRATAQIDAWNGTH